MTRDHHIVDDRRFGHGVCGYDLNGPACGKPATWHYRVTFQGRTRQSYACDTHHQYTLPVSFDHHRVESPCGKPASEWVPRTPGESFCQDPEETAVHLEQLTDLTRPALQPS